MYFGLILKIIKIIKNSNYEMKYYAYRKMIHKKLKKEKVILNITYFLTVNLTVLLAAL